MMRFYTPYCLLSLSSKANYIWFGPMRVTARSGNFCRQLHLLRVKKTRHVFNEKWMLRPTFQPVLSCYMSSTVDADHRGNMEIDFVVKEISKTLQSTGKTMNQRQEAIFRKKLSILLQFDCIISKVPECLDVLRLSEEEIINQGERLKSVYMIVTTPDLFLARDATKIRLATVAFNQLKAMKGYESPLEFLQEKLECGSIHELKETFPFVMKLTPSSYSVLQFGARLDCLKQYGYNIEDFKKDPKVFEGPLFKTHLLHRLNLVKEAFPYMHIDKTLVKEICSVHHVTLSRKLQFKTKYSCIFEGCRTSQDVMKNISKIDKLRKKLTNKTLVNDLNKLEKKIVFLQRLGFSLQSIVENTFCLAPSPRNLEKTVEVVLLENDACELPPDQFISKIIQGIFQQKFLDQMSTGEVDEILKKFNITSKEIEDIPPIRKKFSPIDKLTNFLLEQGYTSDDIKKTPKILEKKMYNIKRRLKIFKEISPDGNLQLDTLVTSSVRFKEIIKLLKKYGPNKMQTMKKMLHVSDDQIGLLEPIKHLNDREVRRKVEYLQSVGISSESIVNDIYCLRIPLKSLQMAVEKLKKHGYKNITLMQITNFSDGKMVEPRGTHHSIVSFVQDKLEIPDVDRKGFWKERIEKKYWPNTVQDIERNIKTLTDFGFELEVLRTCPYIVGHSKEILEEHLEELSEMENLPNCKEFFSDKKNLLNLLQYNIEKNHSFIPVVNDRVLGMDEIIKSTIYKETR